MNQESTFKVENDMQTYHGEYMLLQQTIGIQMEIEASCDPGLVKVGKLTLNNHCIEIENQDKSKVAFSLDDFMGAESVASTKVDQYLIEEGVASLTLYYAQIVKKKVKINNKKMYSKDSVQLQSFRDKCIEAFYSRVQSRSTQIEGASRKRFLFFLSPKSGKGQAEMFYENYKKYFE